jgi:hypothetical protein
MMMTAMPIRKQSGLAFFSPHECATTQMHLPIAIRMFLNDKDKKQTTGQHI